MKCGYFQIQDLLFVGEASSEDCENEATHTSCNYGNVCAEHKCRCSKEIKMGKKLNRYETIDSDTQHITNEVTLEEKVILNPEEGEIELESAVKSVDAGFRVKWTNGTHTATVEEKVDGEWKSIGGIQKLTIEFSVDKELPVVTMEKFVM